MTSESASLAELAKALARDEFVFHYQPKISMLSGKICGTEALIRWIKADGSIVMPDDFIPVAEKTGFISEITLSMLPKLLTDKALIHDVDPSIAVAVNASTRDFESDRLTRMIIENIDSHGKHNLEVEITEASLLSSDEEVRNNLYALPEVGVPLSMDDFANGFSNIDMLASCPFSTIKLDRKIVQRVWESKKDAAIVQSSIRLAHKLGLEIVAEGVDNWRVYHFLLNAGCTQGQGFWISKPLPILELLELLHNQPHWPALPVGLLYMAELDHIEWRKDLMDAVFFLEHCDASNDARPRPEHFPELNHTECGLGRWYYGAGQQFVDNPSYTALEEPHRRLHETGSLLLEAAMNGHDKREVLDYMHMLSVDSATIIGLLQALQNDALSELGDADPDRIRSYFHTDTAQHISD